MIPYVKLSYYGYSISVCQCVEYTVRNRSHVIVVGATKRNEFIRRPWRNCITTVYEIIFHPGNRELGEKRNLQIRFPTLTLTWPTTQKYTAISVFVYKTIERGNRSQREIRSV